MSTAIISLTILISILTISCMASLAIAGRTFWQSFERTQIEQRKFQNDLLYEAVLGKRYGEDSPSPTRTEPGLEIWNSEDGSTSKWQYPSQGLDPTLDTLSREARENQEILQRMRRPIPTEDPGLEMEMDRAGMLQNTEEIPAHIRDLLNNQD